jgi:2-oxoglutarate ferredoxin oxidoreductase subunit alpha
MAKEVRFERYLCDDAELIVVAFGSVARILKSSADLLRGKGRKVGVLRPITLYPFPSQAVAQAARECGHLMAVELNTGQMVEDVRLAVNGQAKVDFYGRPPGSIPTPNELAGEIMKVYRKGGRS